jgi:hypothetical protein
MVAKKLMLLMNLALLLVVACSSRDASVATSKFNANSPEAIVNTYIQACLNGDVATALDMMSPEIRQLFVATNSSPCDESDDGPKTASFSNLYGTEIAGNTARVEWEWKWAQPQRSARYEFILARNDDNWRILDGKYTHRETVETQEITEIIKSQVVTNQDEALLEGINYVMQPGLDGSRTLTKSVRKVNGRVEEEVILGERITAEPRDTIIIAGSKSRAAFLTEAKQFVTDYFAVYQEGGHGDLVGMIFTDDVVGVSIAEANRVARTEIITVNVSEAKSVTPYKVSVITERNFRSEPGRATTLPNQPYVEAPALEIKVPVFIRYRLFDVEVTFDDEVTAIYLAETNRWQLRYWGVLLAVGEQERQTREAYEVQVNGLALVHHAAFVVMTFTRPAPDQHSGISVRVNDDISSSGMKISRLEYIGDSDTGFTFLDPFNRNAINATVWFRYTPRGVMGFQTGEVIVRVR